MHLLEDCTHAHEMCHACMSESHNVIHINFENLLNYTIVKLYNIHTMVF